MGIYGEWVVPHLIACAMRNPELAAYRQRIVPAARGRVLEIGIGSGLNLPLYGPGVTEIIGLDPSHKLIGMAGERARTAPKRISLLESSAEAIPLDAASVDTVVTTWTMCSIPNASAALSEMRRVLKPGGDLLFVEHGRAPEPSVARWQDWLDPVWKPVAGGCHLNRPIADLITGAGFKLVDLRTGYAGRPRAFKFMYEGAARPG
jgi:ubiquinone/menaquinone biosynthesis C-methylase UbiE